MNLSTWTTKQLLDRVTADAKVGIYDVRTCSALAARQMSDDDLLDRVTFESMSNVFKSPYANEYNMRMKARKVRPEPVRRTFVQALVQAIGNLRAQLFPHHEWHGDDEQRTCAICGCHQKLEMDEWGYSWGEYRHGDRRKHRAPKPASNLATN